MEKYSLSVSWAVLLVVVEEEESDAAMADGGRASKVDAARGKRDNTVRRADRTGLSSRESSFVIAIGGVFSAAFVLAIMDGTIKE